MESEVRTLAARLLAQRWITRQDRQVRRVLMDEAFRVELERRLGELGLVLLENPYASHIAVGLAPDVHEPVFGAGREYAASNLGLTRDEIALLVVIWALIILPKRERQVNRRDQANPGQNELFAKDTPVPQGDEVAPVISETALLADFGAQLGGKTKVKNFMLGKLARLGFIERRTGMISEGPLLDLALDYRILADRIIHGTLSEILAAVGHPVPQPLQENLEEDVDDDEVDFPSSSAHRRD